MRFLKQYKCPMCGHKSWEYEEPDVCNNLKCPTNRINYCRECLHFKEPICMDTNEKLAKFGGEYIQINCKSFKGKKCY